MRDSRITLRSMLTGAVVAGFFAFLTAYFENRNIFVTATQIAILPYAALFLTVALVNPAIRMLRIVRPFAVAELLIVFVMGAVSAGIASFGGVTMMLALAGSLYDRQFDTPQYKLDIYVVPFLPDDYFLGEPGLQEVALKRRDVTLKMQDLTAAHRAATQVDAARKHMDDVDAAYRALGEPSDDQTPLEAATRKKLEREKAFAERALEGTERAWEAFADRYDVASIIASYDADIEALRPTREALDAEYAQIAEKAYAKVEAFRTGLPEGHRAMPGWVKESDETLEDYAARFRRMRYGLKSLDELRQADDLLAQASGADVQGELADGVAAHIKAASTELSAVADRTSLVERKADLDKEEADLTADLKAVNASLKDAQERKRTAYSEDRDAIDDEIKDLQKHKRKVNKGLAEVRVRLERMRARIATVDEIDALIAQIDTLGETIRGPPATAVENLRGQIAAIVARYPAIDASFGRYLVGEVPWREWGGVLLRWGFVFGLTYVMLMGLNVLLFRQWAYHEKLIYPLAQLPEILAGTDETGEPGNVPPIYRTGLFWAGLAISGTVMGWNLFVQSGVVPDLPKIPLYAKWNSYVEGSMFAGLASYNRFELIFTVIGLSFLIPANITFSLWSFRVVGMLLVLAMVWLGYGTNEKAFEPDWTLTLNFLTSVGGGALVVFSLVNVYRCREYILCAVRPGKVASLDPPEAKELRTYSLLFLGSSIALILILWLDMGASLFMTLFVYLTILVITIGLVRVVAEGGLMGFQCWFGPFHLIRTVFGMNKAWAAPPLIAPLFVYYAMLFLDIKAFIAPTMANALKIRDDLRMPRLRFHASVYIGIIVAALIGIFTHMTLSYDVGANASSWFLSSFPKITLVDNLGSFARNPPVDATNNRGWLIVGGVAMVGLLVARRRFFSTPHPIGLIMWVNPLMHAYWFSIFLGWLAKKLVTKYGNNMTYERTRCLFVGLIAGELLVVVISLILQAFFDINVRIDLNRNADAPNY